MHINRIFLYSDLHVFFNFKVWKKSPSITSNPSKTLNEFVNKIVLEYRYTKSECNIFFLSYFWRKFFCSRGIVKNWQNLIRVIEVTSNTTVEDYKIELTSIVFALILCLYPKSQNPIYPITFAFLRLTKSLRPKFRSRISVIAIQTRHINFTRFTPLPARKEEIPRKNIMK